MSKSSPKSPPSPDCSATPPLARQIERIPELRKGALLSLAELDQSLHQLVNTAERNGMIPIACIISRPQSDGRHVVLGFGWNQLRDGLPGIHGETGAVINMGRLESGYSDLVATSSLSPCPFCQATLARQMGITNIRILDASNYSPDMSAYRLVGIQPTIVEHPGVVETFARWVNDPAHRTIWDRDIGIWHEAHHPPFSPANSNRQRYEVLAQRLLELSHKALLAGEAPIAAAVVDRFGEVLGLGYSQVKAANDPSMVAAMSAWRAAHARDHWQDKTLLLTCGPDHIAYSMFKIFKFGQLIVASDRVFAGQLDSVHALNVPVHVLNAASADQLLSSWLARTSVDEVREYFGVDYQAQEEQQYSEIPSTVIT